MQVIAGYGGRWFTTVPPGESIAFGNKDFKNHLRYKLIPQDKLSTRGSQNTKKWKKFVLLQKEVGAEKKGRWLGALAVVVERWIISSGESSVY